MNATTVASSSQRERSATILRIAGDVTSASEAELMAGYTPGGRRTAPASIVLDFSRARVHEQRWHRAARHAPRARPARRRAPAGDAACPTTTARSWP